MQTWVGHVSPPECTSPKRPGIFSLYWAHRRYIGRGFASEDDVDATAFGLPGRNAVAVIGYGLWQQLFGADPKALGAIIRIDGHPLTVIGVAPPGFDFPGRAVLWKPAAFSPGNNGWATIARLKLNVPWAQARAAFAIEAKHLTPVRLRGMLLREGPLIVVTGAMAGIAGAQFSGRFLETLIDGAKPIDLGMSAGLVLVLALVASISIWSASRRISRFDITAILRSE